MNLHVFCIHINIMLLLQYALSKTLPEAVGIDSESKVISKSADNTESIHETNDGSFKQLKSDRLKEHIRKRRASEEKSSIKKQCAVMYKNDEPVGILQPYKDSYQFLPIHSDEHIPVDISPFSDSQTSIKRDTSVNADNDEDAPELGDETLKRADDTLPFADDRYPYIFAKFKIDSRIEKPGGTENVKQRTIHKRDSEQALVDEKHSNSLSSTLSRIRTNDDGAEAELRNILNDMGLIDDETHIDKRQAELNEDEDLEHETNKINLIKFDSTEERPKREESTEKYAKRSETATKHYDMIEIPEPKTINEDEYIDQYVNKEDQAEKQNKKGIEKRSDNVAAQIEREIKSKLQKIKEEVRNEIDKIKSGSNSEEFENIVGEDEEPEQSEEKEKSQRRKRNIINTLTDEETSDINPVMSADNRLVPHIRRRRKRGILDEDMLPDDREDLTRKLKRSENKAVMPKSNVTISSEKATASVTNFIIDLNPEIKSREKPNNINTRKRNIDEESTLEINKKEKIKSKNNKQNNKRTGIDVADQLRAKKEEIYHIILNPRTELENMQHYLNPKYNRNQNYTVKENLLSTTEHFLVRNLMEYEDDAIRDNQDKAKLENGDDKNEEPSLHEYTHLEKRKKRCKCSNGDKDCKCGKTPAKLLRDSDGSNFVYIDDVPRLVDKPDFHISKEINENVDKNNPSVNMKLLPLLPDKKRSKKEDRKYYKSIANFAKNLRDGAYTLDIDPDVYRITEENSQSFALRRKRDSFSDLVAIHGGGPILDHLVAIRERSMLPRIRVKRSSTKAKDQQLTLTDMSGEDLFGALPQGFEGELARYKRVKRAR